MTLSIPRNWSFERDDVASGFDRHVREQLPWYDLATNAVAHLARHYISEGGLVYDLGASTGNIGRALGPILQDRSATLVAIESSQQMCDRYDAPGEIRHARIEQFDYEQFDLAVAFLALMFLDPHTRSGMMRRLRHACKPGGAIIVFDKMEPVGGYLSTILYRLTLAGKVAAGVSSDEIIQKELSLAGVQRPINYEQLGGEAREWFRFGDFAGWIIERAV